MNITQEGSFKKKLLALAILAPAMTLTACSSSNNDGPAQPTSQSTSGVAYDGYLRNATICVDENLNRQCDEGEPSAITGAGGKFTIDGLTDVQAKLPLVLKAVAGETIDEDGGEPVDNDFTYLAPSGSQAVSAFSTIIQVKKERLIASGTSVAEAETQAKLQLAIDLGIDQTIDLSDYDAVAGTGTDTDGQLAANLHIVNQVLTRNIVEAQRNLTGNSSSPAAALLAVIEKVSAKASVIKAKVDSAVQASGSVAADLDIEALDNILDGVLNDPDAQPEAITQEDLDQAAADAEAAKDAILDAAQPDATGGTGGTGS